MPGQHGYHKASLRCTARQFSSLMHTLQRDGGGLWPAREPQLEICAVANERFDDPFVVAGWVIYEAPPPDAALRVDLFYTAATIEVYDMPGGCCVVYFTDGQEPGGFGARSIGAPFAALADAILRQADSLA